MQPLGETSWNGTSFTNPAGCDGMVFGAIGHLSPCRERNPGENQREMLDATRLNLSGVCF